MRFITAMVVLSTVFSTAVLAAESPAPAAPAATPAAPAVAGTVARAQFTNGVQEREPIDSLTSLTGDKTQVYFYTELKNLAGAKVMHRWEYKGQVMAEVPFEVGAARWRVWSLKAFDPSWTGEWKVSVVDGSGTTLAVHTLTYGAPAQPAAAPKQ